MKVKKILALVLTLCMAFSLCGGTIGLAVPTKVKAAGKISASKRTLLEGQFFVLKVTDASGDVVWKSSNKKVTSVTAEGRVTAKKAGTSKITAVAGGESFTCNVTVKAAKPAPAKDFYYKVEDGGITIESYNGTKTTVVIPKKINGKKVKKLGYACFPKSTVKIKDVVLPDGLEVIGEYAFSVCNVKKICIPDSVKTIEKFAFNNAKMDELTIGDGVTEIGERAFCCENLKTINWGKNLKKIGEDAFHLCRSLKSVEIPDSVEEVGKETFWDCENLKSVKIGKGIKVISENMFGDCEKLSKVTIPEGVEDIEYHAFANCKSLKTVSFPNSLKRANGSSFMSFYNTQFIYKGETYEYLEFLPIEIYN